MTDPHRIYLSLGSNIQPEIHLRKALDLLRKLGNVPSSSSVWESEAVGSDGPNFLNVCILFLTDLPVERLKAEVVQPVETALGRIRTKDKFAPRTIDIDIMMVDGRPTNLERWNHPYVVLPMAELIPQFPHPLTHEELETAAHKFREQIWIIPRPDVIRQTP